jgi:hypothetical protein
LGDRRIALTITDRGGSSAEDIRMAGLEVALGTGVAVWATMTAARSPQAAITSVETDHQATAAAPPVAAPPVAAPPEGVARLAVEDQTVEEIGVGAVAVVPAVVKACGTKLSTFRSYRFSTQRI